MPSSIATNVRGALKTAISSVAANCYDAVPAAPQVPSAVIVPAAPYLETVLISKTATKVKVNLIVTLGVANYDNPSALDNLEQLAISVLTALPAGYILGSVSNPIPVELASGAVVLASEIEVSTYYTQT
jgi:hypothetical protein